jgi:hypothetical protein
MTQTAVVLVAQVEHIPDEESLEKEVFINE